MSNSPLVTRPPFTFSPIVGHAERLPPTVKKMLGRTLPGMPAQLTKKEKGGCKGARWEEKRWAAYDKHRRPQEHKTGSCIDQSFYIVV